MGRRASKAARSASGHQSGQGGGAQHRALALARHEYLLCIDGDALLDPYAGKWLMRHFLTSPRVGAVTGNPRIRNRTTLLGRLQVGEFTAIIGLIKRAQRTYGRLFTVSGVITAPFARPRFTRRVTGARTC
ncbi:glycosyltransferase [Chromobacterium haemolyticum]|nr:glycosyltransferase [Chromobacterium haemolyticum]